MLAAVIAFTPASTPATSAGEPDVATALQRMRATLSPEGPSIREMTVRVSGPEGAATPITLRQARATADGTRHVLTVVLAPEEAAGTALLLSQRDGGAEDRWLYAPVVRRTRNIVPVLRHEPFLNSDFTYADLGLVDARRVEGLQIVRAEDGKGYGLEEQPRDQTVYGRVVTWFDPTTNLPRSRDIYDRAGRLWKVERFEEMRAVDGGSVPMRRVMEDVQVGGRTEIVTTEVRRDVTLPDALFDPTRLSAAADADVWTAVARKRGSDETASAATADADGDR